MKKIITGGILMMKMNNFKKYKHLNNIMKKKICQNIYNNFKNSKKFINQRKMNIFLTINI